MIKKYINLLNKKPTYLVRYDSERNTIDLVKENLSFYRNKIMIKNIIFDLDGTLANTSKDIIDSLNYSLKKIGFKKSKS